MLAQLHSNVTTALWIPRISWAESPQWPGAVLALTAVTTAVAAVRAARHTLRAARLHSELSRCAVSQCDEVSFTASLQCGVWQIRCVRTFHYGTLHRSTRPLSLSSLIHTIGIVFASIATGH
jgi:hypothetical protein